MSLGVGIIGFGRIGAEHAGWISALPRDLIRVACVADGTRARATIAKSRAFDVVAGVDELLKRDDVAAVLVATPTSMHFDHASAALAAGKHVMVEKPITLDLPHARRLVDEAERRGRVLSVFHNRRWDVDFLTVKRAVDAGVFGKVINVESRLGQWGSCVGPAAREYRPNWRNEAGFGGGALYDWGSHFVDQAWRLLWPAKPVRVFAQLRGNVWSSDCDDFARVLIDFDSGACAVVEINTTTTRPLPRWHVDGTLGSGDSPYSLAFDTREWARLTFTPSDGSGSREVEMAPAGLSEGDIWRAFADACTGRGEPAVSAASVLPTMALLDAARVSSREGRAVEIDGSVFEAASR
jgi:predicted dehydrogenase